MILVPAKILDKELVGHHLRVYLPVLLLVARFRHAPTQELVYYIVKELEVHEVHGLEALPIKSVTVRQLDLLAHQRVIMELEILRNARRVLPAKIQVLLFPFYEIF